MFVGGAGCFVAFSFAAGSGGSWSGTGFSLSSKFLVLSSSEGCGGAGGSCCIFFSKSSTDFPDEIPNGDVFIFSPAVPSVLPVEASAEAGALGEGGVGGFGVLTVSFVASREGGAGALGGKETPCFGITPPCGVHVAKFDLAVVCCPPSRCARRLMGGIFDGGKSKSGILGRY